MNRDEAFAILGIDDTDDALDAYESLIFEQQKFFLSNPVLLKTFQSRLKKAETAHRAYVFLEGEIQPETIDAREFQPDEVLSKHMLAYFQAKNLLKKNLAANPDFPTVELVIKQMLELEREYVAPFAAYDDWTDETVLVSKEPDVMDILELVRAEGNEGRRTLEQLHEAKDKLPEMLRKELKRLSLLTNYLYE